MTVALFYLISALDMSAFGLLIPILNPHLIALGSSHFSIGLLNSSVSLVQFISSPLFGSLSDTKGRKPTLLRTLSLGALSNVVLALFSTSYFGIFISRIIFAISNQTMVLLKALIADNTPTEKQATIYGNLGAFAALGIILGPILAGIIMDSDNGFFKLALITSALTVVNICVVSFVPASTPKKPKGDKDKQLSFYENVHQELAKVVSNFKSLDWNLYWDIFTLRFLVEAASQMFYSSFGLILIEAFEFSQKQMGYMLALHALLIIVFNLTNGFVKGRLYKDDRDGVMRIKHALFLQAVNFVGFSLAASWWVFGLFMVPFSFARVLTDTTWTEVLVLRTKESDRGTVTGAFESIMPLAGLIVPVVSGLAIDLCGISAPSFLALVPLAVSIYISRKMQKIRVQ